MAYATTAEVKTYLGITESGDDTLIGSLIDRATGIINRYTGRKFEASVSTARYYTRHAVDRLDSSVLLVDEDLLTVTELLNGDDATTTISSGDYWLYPFNASAEGAPYWGIKLKEDTDHDGWEFDTDGRVKVTGTWGYAATVPDAIKHATIRLAGYLYRQRDSQVFETTADPMTGQMIIPPGMPKDVRLILDGYKRLV